METATQVLTFLLGADVGFLACWWIFRRAMIKAREQSAATHRQWRVQAEAARASNESAHWAIMESYDQLKLLASTNLTVEDRAVISERLVEIGQNLAFHQKRLRESLDKVEALMENP